MLKTNLRVGITGAGVFGGYHAAKMIAHDQVDFVGIYDPVHPERAQKLANECGAKAVSSREELIEVADALIIASPATAHGRQGLDALNNGLHVLVEKPIATDLEIAREMVAVARSENLVLQVGHQERFVSKAIGLFDIQQAPKKIFAKRVCAFSERGIDVSVTLDLMIHDLDMITAMVGMMPIRTNATTLIGPSGGIDEATVCFGYQNGLEVELFASRMQEQPVRTMDIVYDAGQVHVDYLNKSIIHDTPFELNHEFANDPLAMDSLGASDNAFVDAVLNGNSTTVSGIDGARALALALEIDHQQLLAANIAV
ncbi:MAG: Gfo/Idh/MocA family oxidoreductase [Robiginitomaculum sp.]|nr:Gfo/Idh/MocA family oxidoreductase [Robiginitomaculum sp.]